MWVTPPPSQHQPQRDWTEPGWEWETEQSCSGKDLACQERSVPTVFTPGANMDPWAGVSGTKTGPCLVLLLRLLWVLCSGPKGGRQGRLAVRKPGVGQ